MNVSCPKCETTYRVDPAKVPARGVRARCTQCGELIRIDSPAAAAPGAGPSAVGSSPAGASSVGQASTAGRAAESDSVTKPVPAAATAAQAVVREEPSPEPIARSPEPSAEPASGSSPRAPAAQASSGAHPAPAFGAADPDAKARRLARALVSDIVVYHPERRERSVAAGTLRQEFREEIQKSWEEYVAQVGDSVARGTPHFREALNEILAGGNRVF